jgi:hypothetical protein
MQPFADAEVTVPESTIKKAAKMTGILIVISCCSTHLSDMTSSKVGLVPSGILPFFDLGQASQRTFNLQKQILFLWTERAFGLLMHSLSHSEISL